MRALLCSMVLMLGCPAQVENVPKRKRTPAPAATPPVPADDPRVEQEGEDLYAAETVERTKDPEPKKTGLGSGKPDRSNGVCQLYAPELPKPECCPHEHGFDAASVAKTCGFGTYLGESLQASCGYFFSDPKAENPTPWFRTSFVDAEDARAAAASQAKRLRVRQKAEGVKAQAVPGAKGAYWVKHKGYVWAFMPGWSRVRQLAWKDPFCAAEDAGKVVAKMIAAKEPGPRDRRLGLVPKARS